MIKRFRIYRNLHKGNFSIQGYVKHKKGYRVVDRVCSAILKNVTFRVYESGRQKVLEEQRKNVHAYVTPISYDVKVIKNYDVSKLREIYYNPYKHETFVYKDTGEMVCGVIDKVLLKNNKVYELKE
jgi:ribosome maturation protein Sdo1